MTGMDYFGNHSGLDGHEMLWFIHKKIKIKLFFSLLDGKMFI